MPRLVISTVGTSLLTNQIDRDTDPDIWSARLKATANYTVEQVQTHAQDVSDIIKTLKVRAEEKLYGDDATVEQIREASAELNGIYSLYEEKLKQGIEDIHLLVATNTAQGEVAAEIVESFLKNQGLANTSSYAPQGLTTACSEAFEDGMAKLIPYLQETIVECQKNRYEIYFNLVGGFKALQGYFNTIGMFYADEIIYIFEGSTKEIKIPRLPITINQNLVEAYEVQLAMMSQSPIFKFRKEGQKVPKEWILCDGQEMTLSTWGQLIWEQCKRSILSKQKLLKFPKLEYEDSFEKDYESKTKYEKVMLQEHLARAACLLNNHQDGISAMKQDGIFRLRRYEGKHKHIGHFDLPKDRRVSCVAMGDTLRLRHYGEHDYVNNNP